MARADACARAIALHYYDLHVRCKLPLSEKPDMTKMDIFANYVLEVS